MKPVDPNFVFVFWVLGFLTGFLTFTGRVVTLGIEQIAGLIVGVGMTILSFTILLQLSSRARTEKGPGASDIFQGEGVRP